MYTPRQEKGWQPTLVHHHTPHTSKYQRHIILHIPHHHLLLPRRPRKTAWAAVHRHPWHYSSYLNPMAEIPWWIWRGRWQRWHRMERLLQKIYPWNSLMRRFQRLHELHSLVPVITRTLELLQGNQISWSCSDHMWTSMATLHGRSGWRKSFVPKVE